MERFTPGPDADPDYAARVARLYAAGHWAVWRFCIDREFLVKYNLLFWNEVRWAEDYPFDLVLAGACPKLYYLDVELVVYRANRAGSLLNAGLAKHFAGIAAVIQRFEKMFAAPDCPWTPAEQMPVSAPCPVGWGHSTPPPFRALTLSKHLGEHLIAYTKNNFEPGLCAGVQPAADVAGLCHAAAAGI